MRVYHPQFTYLFEYSENQAVVADSVLKAIRADADMLPGKGGHSAVQFIFTDFGLVMEYAERLDAYFFIPTIRRGHTYSWDESVPPVLVDTDALADASRHEEALALLVTGLDRCQQIGGVFDPGPAMRLLESLA